MDPNELLRELRELAPANSYTGGWESEAWARRAEEALRRFMKLDKFLSKGGPLPDDWAYEKRAYGLAPRTENPPDPGSLADQETHGGEW